MSIDGQIGVSMVPFACVCERERERERERDAEETVRNEQNV